MAKKKTSMKKKKTVKKTVKKQEKIRAIVTYYDCDDEGVFAIDVIPMDMKTEEFLRSETATEILGYGGFLVEIDPSSIKTIKEAKVFETDGEASSEYFVSSLNNA